MTMEQALAIEYLRREPVRNISLIEPLRLGRAALIARTDRGVLLNLDGIAMVAADTPEEGLKLLEAMPDFRNLNAAGGALADAIRDALDLEDERCWQAVYPSRSPLPVEADIRPLGVEYLEPVAEHYSLFHNPDYIRDRLERGLMSGAFVDGRLAGFIGEHEEGSMGLLEVFPEYRRRGLGLALESFEINRFLSEGRVPYDQVIVGNEKSLGLQRKLGMVISEDTISWLHPKRNG